MVCAVIAFIHDQKTKAASLVGARRSVDVADLQTGNADAGRRYFDGAGRCASCHSPTGDLAGVANRLMIQTLRVLPRSTVTAAVRRAHQPIADTNS